MIPEWQRAAAVLWCRPYNSMGRFSVISLPNDLDAEECIHTMQINLHRRNEPCKEHQLFVYIARYAANRAQSEKDDDTKYSEPPQTIISRLRVGFITFKLRCGRKSHSSASRPAYIRNHVTQLAELPHPS